MPSIDELREIERRSREKQIEALGLEMVEFIERTEALTDEDIAREAEAWEARRAARGAENDA
jgi:hypothetical protein